MTETITDFYTEQSLLFNRLAKVSIDSPDSDYDDLVSLEFASDDEDTVVGSSRNGSLSGPVLTGREIVPSSIHQHDRTHRTLASDTTFLSDISHQRTLSTTTKDKKASKKLQNKGEIVSFYVQKKDPSMKQKEQMRKTPTASELEPLISSSIAKRILRQKVKKAKSEKTEGGEEVVLLETSDPDFFHSLSANDKFGRAFKMEELENKVVLVKLKKEEKKAITNGNNIAPKIVPHLPIGEFPKTETPDFFYSLSALDKFGKKFEMSQLRGKVVLIVNTASKCKLASQFIELQALYEKYKDEGLVVIAFPTSQFGFKQELDTDKEILQFCKLTYGVQFPIMKKIDVNGKQQHLIFKYLKNFKRKYFGVKKITWNFEKFLIDREGRIVKRVPSFIKPRHLTGTIEELLRN